MLVAKDPGASSAQRAEAIEEIWRQAEAGALPRATARETLKSIVWSNQPSRVRVKAVEMLLRDASEEGIADTRNMLSLRLPTETDWGVIDVVCDAAGDRGWTDLTPAIVRSYSRPVRRRPDDERPERAAILRLHPGRTLEEAVYGVFATPAPASGSALAKERAERARRDAWELLGRLDPTGSKRRGLLAAEPEDAAGDPMMATLRAAARELRAVPVTGSELEWALQLRGADPALRAWWEEAARVLATLSDGQAEGLALRHAEPARWAAENRPRWLSMERSSLLEELRGRLAGRKVYEREAEAGSPFGARRERLRDNEDDLAWGDVLAILVIDEALKDGAVVRELFDQVTIDRQDTSTEHGGVIEAAGTTGFRAVHYPPRPTQRVNDTTFIAPEELFRQSPLALAHYHFHVQQARNARYAGPGPGDLEYADKHGRSCLVLTSIDERTLNVDYYHRGGAVVDLGVIGLAR